jgi:hypothetical protein
VAIKEETLKSGICEFQSSLCACRFLPSVNYLTSLRLCRIQTREGVEERYGQQCGSSLVFQGPKKIKIKIKSQFYTYLREKGCQAMVAIWILAKLKEVLEEASLETYQNCKRIITG